MPLPWLSRIGRLQNVRPIATGLHQVFRHKLSRTLKHSHLHQKHFDENEIIKKSRQIANAIEAKYLSSRHLKRPHIGLEHRKALEPLDNIREDYEFLLGQHVRPIIQQDFPILTINDIAHDFNLIELKRAIKKYSLAQSNKIDNESVNRFLAHQVFLFRSGLNHRPLLWLLETMNNDKQLEQWLSKKLIIPAQKSQGELWKTGEHEWIPRAKLIDVLSRSAGLTHATPFVYKQGKDDVSLLDWLSLQNQMRSPIKYMYFKQKNNLILSGHTPAIKSNPLSNSKRGEQTKGSYHFHQKLEQAFDESTTHESSIKKAQKIALSSLYSGDENLQSVLLGQNQQSFFSVRGIRTTEVDKLQPHLREAAEQRNNMFDALIRKC
jgi:hypothetical protein